MRCLSGWADTGMGRPPYQTTRGISAATASSIPAAARGGLAFCQPLSRSMFSSCWGFRTGRRLRKHWHQSLSWHLLHWQRLASPDVSAQLSSDSYHRQHWSLAHRISITLTNLELDRAYRNQWLLGHGTYNRLVSIINSSSHSLESNLRPLLPSEALE